MVLFSSSSSKPKVEEVLPPTPEQIKQDLENAGGDDPLFKISGVFGNENEKVKDAQELQKAIDELQNFTEKSNELSERLGKLMTSVKAATNHEQEETSVINL